jgi:ABC-2 type transport system permease protein
VRGRQLAAVVVFGVPAVALSALMVAITGTADLALPIGAVLLAGLGVGCGVAAVLSVLGATPGVDPHRRVNPNDAGENSLVLQVAFWLMTVLIAPAAAMAAVLALASGLPAWFAVATVVVAVLNAGLVAWGGGAIAVARLQARLPETFARLRYPGTVVTAPGGDLLDRFARQAEATAIEAAEARAEKVSG